MGINFANIAGKKLSPSAFLKEAKSDGLKYKGESGKTHVLYIPYYMSSTVDADTGEEVESKEAYARGFRVHEWTEKDKFKSTICIDGVIARDEETGELILDGTCPICERIQDGWEIYNYRKEKEEAESTLTGEALTLWMEGVKGEKPGRKHDLLKERKAKESVFKLYMLVASIKMKSKTLPELGEDGLPIFELKVMNASESRVEGFNTIAEESGVSVSGTEFRVVYPETTDTKNLYYNSKILVAPSTNSVLKEYPDLEAKINEAAERFSWDNISSTFPELKGMTVNEMRGKVESLFKHYDNWKEKLESDPSAEYLEYSGAKSKPSIDGEAEKAPKKIEAKGGIDPNSSFGDDEEEPSMDDI